MSHRKNLTSNPQPKADGQSRHVERSEKLPPAKPHKRRQASPWYLKGTLYLAIACIIMTAALITGCTTAVNNPSTTNGERSITSISVEPTTAIVNVAATLQLHAIATLSDGSTSDVTTESRWTSSKNNVATINSAGLATGVAKGETQITVVYKGFSGTGFLTVTNETVVSIAVTPNQGTTNVGGTCQFTAIGTFSDGSKSDVSDMVAWSSSNTSVATISNTTGSNGLASGVKLGSSTITASYTKYSVSNTATLTVRVATLQSIAVYSTDNCVNIGGTLQYRAMGYYDDNTVSDLTGNVTWNSSAPAVASINASGLATGVAAAAVANTIITATPISGGSITGQVMLIVNPGASAGSVTMTIVNNSGYPDEAVYLTQWGNPTDFHYNPFCKSAISVEYDLNGYGNYYSYPLVGLTKVGTNTYTFPCPVEDMESSRINLSLGGPLLVGRNGGPINSLVEPSVSSSTIYPFDFYEADISQDNQGVYWIDFNLSNVDFFSLGLKLAFSASGTTTTFGFADNARASVIQAITARPAYSPGILTNSMGTTIRVLAPKQILALSLSPALTTYLDSAITSAWNLYKGPNNANIPSGGWTYGAFTFTPISGSASTINVHASSVPYGEEDIYLPQMTTTEVFSNTISGSASKRAVQSMLISSIMRGVGDAYTHWGSGVMPNQGYPDKYYINTLLPFNLYASTLHSFALSAANYNTPTVLAPLCYAFDGDDYYHQDPSSGSFRVIDVTEIKLTIPSFNRSL